MNLPKPGRWFCYWCQQGITDQREASGGVTVDWATEDGDFGCDQHPITGPEEGTGPHETIEEVRAIVVAYHHQPGGIGQ